MTVDGAGQRVAGRRPRMPVSWWSVLRIVLIALWVAWAGLTWWSTPREATVAQARADLAAGQVVAYEWADNWERDTGWAWINQPDLRSSGEQGPLFAWRTPDRRTHYTELDATPPPAGIVTGADHLPTERSGYSGPEAASLGQAVTSTGLDSGTPALGGTWPPVSVVTLLLAALALAVLVSEPAPVTGTRWYWFWVGSGVPFGLGLLYWLARERPWSSTARPPVIPLNRDPRLRWYHGIALAILATILGSLLVYGLNRLLGEAWAPRPGG